MRALRTSSRDARSSAYICIIVLCFSLSFFLLALNARHQVWQSTYVQHQCDMNKCIIINILCHIRVYNVQSVFHTRHPDKCNTICAIMIYDYYVCTNTDIQVTPLNAVVAIVTV